MKKILTYIVTIFVAFLVIGTINTSANAAVTQIDNLVCNPGEDAATSLRFTWNSSDKKTIFEYTVESDPEFKNSTSVMVDGVFDDSTFPCVDSDTVTKVEFYNYDYVLEDLTPGTNYLYRVRVGRTYGKTHQARTSSLDGSFSFIWVSDAHCNAQSWSFEKRRDAVNRLVEVASEQCGGAYLVVSSGDSVAYGSWYDDWKQWNDSYTKSNMVWACVPGNHDYYDRTSGSSVMWNKSSVGYKSIYWEANNNQPDNGLADYESNYYFLYNSVLFIGLDSILQSSGGKHREIQAWFRDVMAKMEGKYQYIVVYQHYPMFDGEEADGDKYGHCGYDTWKTIFDEYGVDLVLTGDSHVYLRSYPLKGDKVDATGTTYVNAPQVGDRYRYIEAYKNKEKIAKRISSYSSDKGTSYNATDYLLDNSGISYFTVTSEGITGKLIDKTFQVKDEYYMQPKRELPTYLTERRANEEELLLESATFVANADKDGNEYLYLDAARVSYASKITATVNGSSFTLTDGNKINLGNLTDNSGYTITLEAEFSSGSKLTSTVLGSTYPSFGTIDSLHASKSNGKVELSWKASLSNNVVDHYKAFYGDEEIGNCGKDATSIVCSKDAIIGEAYTLVAYTASGEEIFRASCIFKVMGDSNNDGLVDRNDLNSMADYIFAGASGKSELEQSLIDIDLDGVITYKDLMLVYGYIEEGIDTLDTMTHKVVFRDFFGNTIKTENVKLLGNATAPNTPTVDGYTFSHWEGNFQGVTNDLVIYAVYMENK